MPARPTTWGPIDTNGHRDVYLRDLEAGTTTLVSVNADGTDSGRGESTSPAFSPDGSKVLFAIAASDLIPADTNNNYDFFVRDIRLLGHLDGLPYDIRGPEDSSKAVECAEEALARLGRCCDGRRVAASAQPPRVRAVIDVETGGVRRWKSVEVGASSCGDRRETGSS